MTIVLDARQADFEDTGMHWSVTPHEQRVQTTIRVGTRNPRSGPGPLGTMAWTPWSSDPRFRASTHARSAFYQETRVWIYPHARILHEGTHIHVRNATQEHLEILDRTLGHVPPAHLECLAGDKKMGICLTEFVGTPSEPNFSGGLNAGVDLPYTPWEDRDAVLITYAALWAFAGTGVCQTVFHELGHVMTHFGLHVRQTDPGLWDLIRGRRVSTNTGELEAVCDGYMHMIAGGSPDARVRRGARNESDILTSQRMRNALLGSPPCVHLPEEWRRRLQ